MARTWMAARGGTPDQDGSERAIVTELQRLYDAADETRNVAQQDGTSLVDIWESNGLRFLGQQWETARRNRGEVYADSIEGGSTIKGPSSVIPGNQRRCTLNRTGAAIISGVAARTEQTHSVRISPQESSDPPMYFLKESAAATIRALLATGAQQLPVLFDDDQLYPPDANPGWGPTLPLSEGQAAIIQQLATPEGGLLVEQDPLWEITDQTRADVAFQLWEALSRHARIDYYLIQSELYAAIFGHSPMLFQWDAVRHRFVLKNLNVLGVMLGPEDATCIEEAGYVILTVLKSLDQAKAEHPEYADELQLAADNGDLSTEQGRQVREWGEPKVAIRTYWQRWKDMPGDEEQGVQPHKGILQTTVLLGIERIVERQECPYWDVPILWNLNMPRPYSPYGQGEPERLADIQDQINLSFTAMYRHLRHYQAPCMLVPEELLERWKAAGMAPFVSPGRFIGVPMSQWRDMQGGKMAIDHPQMPAMAINHLQMLLTEFDRLSGNQDVLQGRMPSAAASGVAIEQLRAEARGPLGFKARYTEWTLERLVNMALHAIVKWLPQTEAMQIVSQYPWPVLRTILEGIDPERLNVQVEIAAGRGINSLAIQNRAERLYMGGAAQRLISRRSAMEMFDVRNPEVEAKRIDQEVAQQVAAQTGAIEPAQQAPAAASQMRAERMAGAGTAA